MGNFIEIKQMAGSENIDNNNCVGLEESLQTYGAIHINADGSVSRSGVETYHPDSDSGFDGPVMSSLTNRQGRPINDLSEVESLEDAIVTVRGVQCTVATALNSGILVRDGNGNISESTKTKETIKQAEEKADESQKTVQVTLAPRSEVLDSMKTKIGDRAVSQTVSQAINCIIQNKDAGTLLESLSNETGYPIDKVHSALNQALEAVQVNAADAISKHSGGIDGAEVLEWLHTEVRPDVRASLLNRMVNNDVSSLNELVERYRLQNKSW